MKSVKSHSDPAPLTDALARLITDLRSGLDVHAPASRFTRLMAEHVCRKDEILFPALRETDPGAAARLEPLERDHRLFRFLSRSLARRIERGDGDGSRTLARAMLASLLEHVDRESSVLGDVGRPGRAT